MLELLLLSWDGQPVRIAFVWVETLHDEGLVCLLSSCKVLSGRVEVICVGRKSERQGAGIA
jgi:hypothetical protein